MKATLLQCHTKQVTIMANWSWPASGTYIYTPQKFKDNPPYSVRHVKNKLVAKSTEILWCPELVFPLELIYIYMKVLFPLLELPTSILLPSLLPTSCITSATFFQIMICILSLEKVYILTLSLIHIQMCIRDSLCTAPIN